MIVEVFKREHGRKEYIFLYFPDQENDLKTVLRINKEPNRLFTLWECQLKLPAPEKIRNYIFQQMVHPFNVAFRSEGASSTSSFEDTLQQTMERIASKGETYEPDIVSKLIVAMTQLVDETKYISIIKPHTYDLTTVLGERR